jgi:predicted DNA-binding protein with PD1-like motif
MAQTNDNLVVTQTGMHRDAAQRLAQKVATGEARLPTDALLKFASFEGMLRVDNAAAHPHAHGATAQGNTTIETLACSDDCQPRQRWALV